MKEIVVEIQEWLKGGNGCSVDGIIKAIKDCSSQIDNDGGKVKNVSYQELLPILSSFLEDPRITFESALVAAALVAKVEIFLSPSPEAYREEFKLKIKGFEGQSLGQFRLLSIIAGLFNCGGPLSKAVLKDFGFLRFLLSPILSACSTPWSYVYQCFLVLRTWSFRLLEVEPQSEADLVTETVSSCILFSMSNWENPIRGVSDVVEDFLKNILDFYQRSDDKGYPDLIHDMWKSNHGTVTWKSKAKYPVIGILLPRLGAEDVLKEYPNFGYDMCNSLTSTHLCQAGTKVYRIITKSISTTTWKNVFLRPLLDVLMGGDENARSNCLSYWIPLSIKVVEGSGALLLDSLSEESGRKAWIVRCAVLKNKRMLGLGDLSEEEMQIVRQALAHGVQDVRCVAFSVLCNQRKRADPPSEVEMSLVEHYVVENLNVDSSHFRQEFMSDLTSYILRCRNFCVANYRKAKQLSGLGSILHHIDRVARLFLDNLFPGANYQRLITSLEGIQLIATCFHTYEPGGINKSYDNSSPQELLHHTQNELSIMIFYSTENLERLLTCILHYMCDIRDMARRLLVPFAPPKSQIIQTFNEGLNLLCSPKFGLCESGAILLFLSQEWAVRAGISLKEVVDDVTRKSGEDPRRPVFNKALHQANCQSFHHLPGFLMNIYKLMFQQLESDFLELSRNSPMHGVLTAIRLSLKMAIGDKEFIDDLQTTVSKIADAMLIILTGKKNVEVQNASFADMGEAIEDLLNEVSHNDGEEEEDDSVSLSDNHSLVLACAWLNLKEASLVSSTAVTTFANSMPESQIKSFGDVISKILTRCRHKGVIEAASLAIGDFSRILLSDPSLPSSVPRDLLEATLVGLKEDRFVSVTRRAAGLPMLISSIVTAEPRSGGHTRKLLEIVVQRLLSFAQDCHSDDSGSDLEDDLQAHSLHILRSLTHDSGLAQDISPFLRKLLNLCLENFNSSKWSIRNASLQLFGALVPRLLGQKKVKSEDATHNSVLMKDFFSRYNYLIDDLHFYLGKFAKTSSGIVNPGLVPLLSLLCRIIRSGDPFYEEMENDISLRLRKFLFKLLASPVVNVRRLSAKAFANFVNRSKLVLEVRNLIDYYLSKKLPTNFKSGILSCIERCSRIASTELPESGSDLGDELKRLKQFFKHEKCFVIRVQLKTILETNGLKLDQHDSETPESMEPFHPSLKEWTCSQQLELSLDDENNELEMKSTEDGYRFIQSLTDVGQDAFKAVQLVNKFMQANLDGTFLNGVMCVSLFNYLLDNCQHVLNDAELALDLLDVPTHEKVKSGELGVGARTSSLPVMAICLSGMVTQPDFKMFFDGGGSYAALVGELCDTLKFFSSPRSLESSRMDAARALNSLLPCFNKRNVKEDFDLHLKYSLCQALNSCFILLSDEDNEIRQEATLFVSRLRFSTNIQTLDFCNFSSLSTNLAQKKLFLYALDNFDDCVEWLTPMVEIFYSAWSDPDEVQKLLNRKNRQVLFETGEGLNVYEEEAVQNMTFAKIFEVWASNQVNALPIHLNINLDTSVTIISRFGVHYRHQQGPFSDSRTHRGYLLALRCLNFLKLARKFPSVVSKRGIDDHLERLLSCSNDFSNQIYSLEFD